MKARLGIKTVMFGAGIAALGLCPAFANSRNIGATNGSPATFQEPDNTSNNKQQSQPGSATADKQKETPEDRDLAQKIRKSIIDDNSLSTYAHNVKVIVRDGNVVLKGPVQTEDEKNSIGAKAAEIAGAGKVKNLLTVKS
jgi:hyperosmotically inducible periplasmic protein